jgi:hypothetical protein
MGTVIVWGPNTKLSIFTAAFAPEGSSLALTLGDTANSSSIPISTGAARPATNIFLFAIALFPFDLMFLLVFLISDWISCRLASYRLNRQRRTGIS